MNYRHSYHAGNFADVFKHIILIAVSNALARKESPYCYLDTHAGIGYYDLLSNSAQKSKEYVNGILKIMNEPNPPKLVQQYIDCIKAINPDGIDPLRYYPGSPYIARHFLRAQDRAVLTELHDDDYPILKDTFHHDKQVAVHHQDGYQALKAFLPPKERRGFILIDPPYEVQDELMQVGSKMATALARFETGVFMLWYPIKERRAIDRFHHSLKDKIKRPILIAELSVHPENVPTHLNGSGLAIVNPPWQLDKAIAEVLPWLWRVLSENKQGRHEIKTL
ncbi:MAG: 23S rRNA (adenine(2030)-N(6))-methyltransferase RlmJ [Gammaproteobacteria bacterium]|nr:23S rRNA (adenine(2030)-N(6))-methyltransferase RlmJ [Gammaproteobacteria bacterium]